MSTTWYLDIKDKPDWLFTNPKAVIHTGAWTLLKEWPDMYKNDIDDFIAFLYRAIYEGAELWNNNGQSNVLAEVIEYALKDREKIEWHGNFG